VKLAIKFWEFIREREAIRLRRAAGQPAPWTEDKILRAYKFTNVKREHDRTSVALKAIYDQHVLRASDRVVWLNCALYRLFGTAEMAAALGWVRAWGDESHRRSQVLRLAATRLATGQRVFTGAYIVPNCGRTRPKHEVVCSIVDGVWKAAPELCDRAMDRWELAVGVLTQLWGIGSFIAKEIVLDYVMATGWRPSDWQTWTPIGPGARRGAMRVLDGKLIHPHGLSEHYALKVCRELYTQRRDQWEDWWSTANHAAVFSDEVRRSRNYNQLPPHSHLDLTDIQFQLCEFDKYQRALRGEGRPRSRFTPT